MNNLGISRIRRENQRLFLNAVEVHGIQSVDLQWDNQLGLLKYIGVTGQSILPLGPGQATCNVSTYVCEGDPFYGYANYLTNGVIIQNQSDTSNNYGFTSGILTSLTSRASVGTIPQMDASFAIFGQAGNIESADSPAIAAEFATIQSANLNFTPNITGPGTLSVSLDDFNTNRLQSYAINMSFPKSVQYILGQRGPTDIQSILPQEVNISFTFEPDTYIPKKMWDFPCDGTIKNITINLNHYSTNKTIVGYSYINCNLSSESYNINVDSNLQTTMNFKVWLLR